MENEVPLYGDVLDAVVSRVSTLDLLPASRVSRTWRSAALSTLRRSPRLPPWLILHLQSTSSANATTGRPHPIHAFVPLSRTWRALSHGPATGAPFLHAPLCSYSRRSGARVYALAHSKLALATDPFGATWRILGPPNCWRAEPAVAVVGLHVVVAGGTAFDDYASGVEVWSDVAGGWQAGDPLPEAFRWTESFSVAATERRMYVLDPKQQIMSWFCPADKQWSPARRLQLPDSDIYLSSIGIGSGRLILLGVSGSRVGETGLRRPEHVRLWAVDEETLEVEPDEIGSMPAEMVKGLVEDDGSGQGGWGLWSIGFQSEGGYAYVYNPSYLKELFLCEYGSKENNESAGGKNQSTCRWERFPRPESVDVRPLERVIFSCSVVEMDDLRMVR